LILLGVKMLRRVTLYYFTIAYLLYSTSGFAALYDIVVVGGGAAGTYSAWRLSENFKDKKICLMESSNRIGGRLFSLILPESPELCAELGGMRFLHEQECVYGLIRRFNLTPEFFDNDSSENIIYVRRVHLQPTDYKEKPGKIPYNLREDEKGKSSRELMMMALHRAFPPIAKMKQPEIREYLKTAEYRGLPVWKFGFWNLLMSQLSIEAYNFIRDAGGYNTGTSNWNAYDAIVSFSKYNADVKFYKVKEGFDALPKKMADLFAKNGGQLSLNTQLTSIKEVQKDGENLIQIFFKTPQGEGSHYARHVILAMPKRAIQLLDCDSFIFAHKLLVDDLKRVDPAYASKVFVWYDEEWWTKLGFVFGPSRTDLPLRQCYYFGVEPNHEGQKRKGLLMASYNDGIAVDFWEGFYQHSAFDTITEKFINEKQYIRDHLLPEEMNKELAKELSELHGIAVPKPTRALFQNWNDDPFGAGWHLWNPHNQSWIVAPRIRHPIDGVNLYICGEAYSEHQGWVEGALQTAEKMLEENFLLERPSWISPDYYLGN
jgi:lysine 2-monooxygenase